MKFNFSPSKEFEEKTKARFLAVFDAQHPAAASAAAARRRPPEFILALRALAIALGCAAVIFGGAAAYADTTNVPADNPLYPLKRLSESVQLALTAPAVRPQLEAAFAAQRASELTDLSARHPSSTLIPRLTGDLAAAMNASISGAEAQTPLAAPASNGLNASSSGSRGNENDHSDLRAVCATLQSFLNPTSSVVKGGFLGHSQALQQFNDRCDGANGAASTPTVATSSTPSIPFHVFPPGRRGGFAPTSSATSTPPAFHRGGGDDDAREKLDGSFHL